MSEKQTIWAIPDTTRAKLQATLQDLEQGRVNELLPDLRDELGGLSPAKIARVSDEIRRLTFESLYGSSPRWFRRSSPERSRFHCFDLIHQDQAYAWLLTAHHDGFVRQAALDNISSPPATVFWFAMLAWRMNDWVPQVRVAAVRCAERVFSHTDARIAAGAGLYLLETRLTWKRWEGFPHVLESVLSDQTVMAEMAEALRVGAAGPLANALSQMLRHRDFDQYLPGLAATAVTPSVRATAHQCLLEGQAAWTTGYDWAWIDKRFGQRRRVPTKSSRPLSIEIDYHELVGRALRDCSAVVRRVGVQSLIDKAIQTPELIALAAPLEHDRSATVRTRATYLMNEVGGASA